MRSEVQVLSPRLQVTKNKGLGRQKRGINRPCPWVRKKVRQTVYFSETEGLNEVPRFFCCRGCQNLSEMASYIIVPLDAEDAGWSGRLGIA
jgi:hypothetical protein